jgi:uncharacterized membrane protein YbhN (UPF0104 family)
MTAHTRQLVKFLIRISITAGLLIFVFSRIDIQQFWQTVKTARWEFLVAAWGLVLIIFIINSINMRLILKKQGCNVGISTLFGASAIASLYSIVMPGMLSSVVKWYILKKDTGKGSNVLSSMLYNQLVMTFVVITFGLVALIITNPTTIILTNAENRWLLPIVCGILLMVIITVFLLLLNHRTGGKFVKICSFLLRPLPAKIRQKGEKIPEQIAIFQTVGWRFHLATASIFIISNVIGIFFIYVFSARAAHITVPAGIFVWLFAVIYLLEKLPISVANLGVREVTVIGTMALYGVDASSALLMSMIIFSITIFMAIIGAVYQLCWIAPRPEKNKQG